MTVQIPNPPASDWLLATLQSTGKLASMRLTFFSIPITLPIRCLSHALQRHSLISLLYTRDSLPTTSFDALAIDTVYKVDIPVPSRPSTVRACPRIGAHEGRHLLDERRVPPIYLPAVQQRQGFENHRTSCRDYPEQNGTTNVTASVDPQTGRSANQAKLQRHSVPSL